LAVFAGLLAVDPAWAKAPLRSAKDFAGKPCQRQEKDKMMCLVCNIYFEARGEPHTGKVAVGRTTLTRITRSEYPDSICGVVWQKNQFSWTSRGVRRLPKSGSPDYANLRESVSAAKEVFQRGPNGMAHFCNPKKSKCAWRKTPSCTARKKRIGNHVFCNASKEPTSFFKDHWS
jgi:spore germination cell wall hydrolase CwlJ-like protein